MSTIKAKDLIPLAILSNIDSGRVEGRTRLQKLAFLTQKELQGRLELDDELEFIHYKYGPFSQELIETVEMLQERGLLQRRKETNLSGDEKYIYTITRKGRGAFEYNLENSSDSDDIQAISESAEKVINSYNELSLSNLIETVYDEYPETAENSEWDKASLT
ncbi:PadR family transcriptional regulator [Natrinema sp. HArc-T2]|uniref:PadR family transcriptional regulator n=1 Tax=Natrinema sp. HArc-T2 TaxID=3242701 RepID=UPI00359D43EA